jgi:hypothetical protein
MSALLLAQQKGLEEISQYMNQGIQEGTIEEGKRERKQDDEKWDGLPSSAERVRGDLC